MASKNLELIGMSIKDFTNLLNASKEDREILFREAHLIPTYKKLDELSLASVFLSSLTMIEEFRNLFCKEIGLSRIGYLKAYTEVSFPKTTIYDESSIKKGPLRVDGLLLQIAGGKIKDGVLFEMKMGSQEVNSRQINTYLNLAKELKIPRLVSISNQFVPSPTDYPVEIQRTNSVSLYHFSWRYIITLGSILLTDNDLNISDPDQVKIMREVMSFFNHPNAAVNTFDSMSREWSELVEGVRARKEFSKNNPCLAVAIQDWIQEEQDLALKMSDKLGVMVDCNKRQYKTMQERVEAEKRQIIEKEILESQFRIKNAVSTLNVQAYLGTRRVVCCVEVRIPQDKKTASARLNWLKRQIDACKLKDEKTFSSIESGLWLNAMVKGRMANPKKLYSSYEQLLEESKNCDVKSVRISYEKDLAARFTQNKKFIEEYEKLVLAFYSVLVQNLKNWEETPPKMNIREAVELASSEANIDFTKNSTIPTTPS